MTISFDELRAVPQCLLPADAVYLVDDERPDVAQMLWQGHHPIHPGGRGTPFSVRVAVERGNAEQYHRAQEIVREYKGPLVDDTELSIPVWPS